MSRTRAERRHNSIVKALHKKKISDEWFKSDWMTVNHYYDNLHQYSKNKIHCSCPICSMKTNNKGYKNWKHSDLVKLERLNCEYKTYG